MVVRRNRKTTFNHALTRSDNSLFTDDNSQTASLFATARQWQYKFQKRVTATLFFKPFLITLIPTVATFVLKTLQIEKPDVFFDGLFPENGIAYSTLSAVLGILLVFRTSQAYNRYWDFGCLPFSRMSREWFDAASHIIAFAETSSAPESDKIALQSTIVALFSLLHACALHSLAEYSDKKCELLDMYGFDADRLDYLRSKDAFLRAEIVSQWVQTTVLDAMSKGIIKTAPPIVSRIFQELNQGLVHLQEMSTLAENPFPLPYSQVVGAMLVFYTFLTPFFAVALTNARGWAGGMTFVAVFVMWTIYAIAKQIELPFGDGSEDLDMESQQQQLNLRLNMLLHPMTRSPIQLRQFVQTPDKPYLKTQTGRLSTVLNTIIERTEGAEEATASRVTFFPEPQKERRSWICLLQEERPASISDNASKTGSNDKPIQGKKTSVGATRVAGVSFSTPETMGNPNEVDTARRNETGQHKGAHLEPNQDDGSQRQNVMTSRGGAGDTEKERHPFDSIPYAGCTSDPVLDQQLLESKEGQALTVQILKNNEGQFSTVDL